MTARPSHESSSSEVWGRDGTGPDAAFKQRQAERRFTEDKLQPHLEGDDKLLWSGRPQHRPWLYNEDRSLLSFALAFFGFSTIWTLGAFIAAYGSDLIDVIFIPLVGLFFMGVGAWLISIPFRSAKRRAGEIYGVTDKRVLVLETRPKTKLRSVPVSALRKKSLKNVVGKFTGLRVRAKGRPALVFRALMDADKARAAIEKNMR